MKVAAAVCLLLSLLSPGLALVTKAFAARASAAAPAIAHHEFGLRRERGGGCSMNYGKYQSQRSQGKTSHDEVSYRSKAGVALSIPQAERYSSRDWFHNIITMPSSIILNRVRVPLIWQMLWSAVVCFAHRRMGFPGMSMKPHTLMGGSLGLLLVFRTNTANGRFWEGRQIWERVVNLSRDFARTSMLYSDVIGTKRVRRMANLLCMFAVVLQEHVQGYKDVAVYAHLTNEAELKELDEATGNRPLLIANKMGKEVRSIEYEDNWSSRERLAMMGMVDKLSDCIGACERLVQTPVPLHYVRHTSRFLIIWCFMLPLVLVSEVGFAAVPIGGIMTWALFGIQEIGLLIEEPFSRSLKLEVFANTIVEDVMQTIEVDAKQPIFSSSSSVESREVAQVLEELR
ncbi:unnamed protein product [Chrysoparadoxa australica]